MTRETLTFLGVDDEQVALLLLGRYINNLFGHNLAEAYSLGEARTYLADNPRPAAVIIDGNLPDGNGIEFAMTEQALLEMAVPVIIASALEATEINHQIAVYRQSDDKRPIHVLPKPINLETLEELITGLETDTTN